MALALIASAKDKPKHRMISPSTADLVAYWALEADPVLFPPIWDQSGNGNHLTPSNFIVDVPGLTTGRIGKGLLFDGVNQRLSLPAGSQTVGHQGNPFTAFFWYKPVTLADGANIVSLGNEWLVSTLEVAPDIFFTFTIDGKALTVSSVPLIAGQWYFVLLGFTGESIFASVNLNGVSFARSSINSSNGSFIIGGNWSNGVYDEFAIFRRSLTDQEMHAIYNGRNGLGFSEYDVLPCSKKIVCCD